MSDGSSQVEALEKQFAEEHALCTDLGEKMPVGEAQLQNPADEAQQAAYDDAVAVRMETLLKLVSARQAAAAA